MIVQFSDLPENTLITGNGGILSIPETQRNILAAIEITRNTKTDGLKKEFWLLATEAGMASQFFPQIIKKAHQRKIEFTKKEYVSEGILKALYEKSDAEFESSIQTGNLHDSEIVKSFYKVMKQVLEAKASDIHIEKRDDSAKINIRKDGSIIPLDGFQTMSKDDALRLCSVIYNVLAEADSKDVTFNESLIQQCAIKASVLLDSGVNQEFKLRFQSVPVYPDGFDVIMRVLPVGKDESYTTLEELGYAPSQVKLIFECVGRAVGTVVIAGVTGSGKSTTLKNLLMWVREDREFSEKLYTVEDPPEYIIPGVSQIPVARRKGDEEKASSPFEDAIKACMRGDPDVIMVGEIRDNATSGLLKKAVQSGHRVFTTVHAPSGLGVIERLVDFGLSNSTLSSQEFISGLMYQRLLGTLCQQCSIPLNEAIESSTVSKSVLEISTRIEKTLKSSGESEENIASYMKKIRLKGLGCKSCNRGVTGRTVCAEVIRPDLTLLKCFKENDMIAAQEHLRNDLADKSLTSKNMTGKSAMAHAFYKMLHGEVDPVELERSFGVISISEIRGLPEVKTEDYAEDWTELE